MEDWNYQGNYYDTPQRNRYGDAYGDYVGGYGPVAPIGMRRAQRGPPPLCPPLGGIGPEHIMGRGYGPTGPPFSHRRSNFEDRAVKYLLRCGLSGESLKHLPRQYLMLVEPQYCGVCGMEFDSFAISRIHYTSKNHFKNQKKWLTHFQNHAGNFHKLRELPLKARELYCELCDVHITSKSHSDAHYAGKPHRAIVDGRKLPKNPLLLSMEMKQRLEQLIRREKKFIKTTEEAAETEPAPKEVKPVPPELYCAICKTSVTCTEQMTIHLNGKKHLNKEKSYILRTMKGENVNADTTAAKTETEVENETSEVIDCDDDDEGGEDGEKTTVNADDDDWQNGTGEAWNEY